jgi:hypothetical protein
MLPLIPLILGAAALVGTIVLVLLNFQRIVDWFQGRQSLKQADSENIAITLNQKLKEGNYKTVQGIFNTNSGKLLDGVQYESENIDEKLAELHRNDELVIYN